jgi:predicted GIY-YIG superfamily endonuclease
MAAVAINYILFKCRQYYSAGYFEGVDRQYNEASAATAAKYVSRENVLATLVFACSHKAARTALPQAERIGANWLNQLCGGIAHYIRQHVCTEVVIA